MNLLDLVYIPLAVVTAPVWARKTRGGWGERFGRGAALPAKTPGRARVLLHGVSVGEVNALRGLVPRLGEMGLEVVVSTTTDTGLARARELFGTTPGGGRATVVRYPLDVSGAVARFLDRVRPDVVALVELELWPNFVGACVERTIPVCVVNGRLSERSFRGYRRLRWFFRKSFGALSLAGVQDEAYAERFVSMGVAPERCRVTGSMKWDAVEVGTGGSVDAGAEALAKEMGIDRSRPLIVAGSTALLDARRPGAGCEEALLHSCVPLGVQLLCAPRRPEHREAAYAALGGAGGGGVGACVRRSDRRPAPAGTDRYLLDTIGELRAAYALADVVVIGRSFGDLYGSDPIEPAALGKPAVIGPAHADFGVIVGELREAGALEVVGAEKLGSALLALVNDPARRSAMGAAGIACVRAHQGATGRHAELIGVLARRERI